MLMKRPLNGSLSGKPKMGVGFASEKPQEKDTIKVTKSPIKKIFR
jgi:hypothetical protein